MVLLLQKEGVKLKLLVSLNNLELEKYLKFTNSFIIGLKNYSINYYEASFDEIEKVLKKYPDIELFVSINKNIFNDDLDDLRYKLRSFAKLKIKGIMFYDISILSLVNDLHLDIPLVIHQEHMITNYNICNYYAEKGVQYAFLSTDITTDEIMEIREKTKINLIVFVAGNVIVTHSKRKLLTNYCQYIASKNVNKNDLNTLKTGVIAEKKQNKDKDEQSQKYYIEETDLGTDILTCQILNGAKAFLKFRNYSNLNNSGISYVVLDSNIKDLKTMYEKISDKNIKAKTNQTENIHEISNKCSNNEQLFLNLLELYDLALNKKIDDTAFLKETSNVLNNDDFDGFFNKKTIYKVKK